MDPGDRDKKDDGILQIYIIYTLMSKRSKYKKLETKQSRYFCPICRREGLFSIKGF